MKMNQKLIMAAIASCLTLPVTARQAQNSNGDAKVYNGRDMGAKVAYRDLEKASKIIGMEITDPQEHKLGSVKDLAIDLKAGRIAEVIVGTGGFVGLDEKMIAVPPESLVFINSGKELRLNDGEIFRTAPFFKMSQWKEGTSSGDMTDVYQRFHVAQPFDRTPGYLDRADKIMGLTARNQQREHLGKVENLVVDLSAGRVVEVIIASGGFLGIKDELSAVPPQAFLYEAAHDTLILNTSKEALKNAPHFKPGDWRNSVNDSASLAGVYDAYNVPPYFTPGSTDTTVENAVPQRMTTPANGADTQSDTIITVRIQQLIRTTEGLSADARAVQVTTQNGRVTLRGMADSDREKKQVGDLAATVVAADHVDNQIEVKNIGATTSLNN